MTIVSLQLYTLAKICTIVQFKLIIFLLLIFICVCEEGHVHVTAYSCESASNENAVHSNKSTSFMILYKYVHEMCCEPTLITQTADVLPSLRTEERDQHKDLGNYCCLQISQTIDLIGHQCSVQDVKFLCLCTSEVDVRLEMEISSVLLSEKKHRSVIHEFIVQGMLFQSKIPMT